MFSARDSRLIPFIATAIDLSLGISVVAMVTELFPKAVDGHDISSGLSFSVDVRDAVDQVL
jgi:hypothetical protein